MSDFLRVGPWWLVRGREVAMGSGRRSSRAGGQMCWFPVDARVRGGRLGDGGERAAGCGRGGRLLVVVAVFLGRPATRVHEEVGDRRHFESELLGDHRLHLLVRPPSLAEDRQQRPTLNVRKHEPRLLGWLMMLRRA